MITTTTTWAIVIGATALASLVMWAAGRREKSKMKEIRGDHRPLPAKAA